MTETQASRLPTKEGQKMPVADELDRKVTRVFAGKVVRKDLVRQVKVGANVPVYVLEYLLGKYCATDDSAAIEAGLRLVNTTLADSVIRPDEAMKAQSRVKERGEMIYIDKISVRLDGTKYWAELVNFGNAFVHIPDSIVRKYDRLLEGGVWAQAKLEYHEDEEVGGKSRPFFITELNPIQLASFKLEDYCTQRSEFTTAEWLDLLVRSMGLEPRHYSQRVKLLMLIRLVPMVQRNYNLIELGPRGTGKSFVYRDLSPYSILISGGKTTVPNLFYNMSTRKVGLVGLWDTVAFDEVAGIKFDDKTAIQILKDYMESGSFSRGREELVADASIVFAGNINQPVDVLVKTSTLFQPLPVEMQDMALIDRIHFYIPGWELPKMRNEFLSDHYGFVVDYLAEAFRELRRRNYTDVIDRYYSLGTDLNTRDAKAVRRTLSGLVKLLHPAGDPSKEEVAEYLDLSLEGRRRVKEQLKKMGSFEYYQTSFSYIDNESMAEQFVGVPEEGGRSLIGQDPLPAGCVYTAAITAADTVALHRIEVSKMSGAGKLRITGNPDRGMKDSIITAFDYVRANKNHLGIERDLESYDFHVQLVDLMQAKEGSQGGVAFFVALYSLLREKPPLAGLVVLGEMTIQGNILPVRSLIEPLQVIVDNGAKKVLVPISNKRQLMEVPGDLLERVDPIFYSEPLGAALKAIGVG
ncbi:MAG: protease Lon-related BREX system protein BrxL [Anaerolineaceae bacterium]|nr:protease Lon-related BREX system protein BrxL [Anaerolineaceae bacterium]